MNPDSIANHFARMGARFRLVQPDLKSFRRWTIDYTLDLARDKRGQIFELCGLPSRLAELDVQVLQCGKAERHLLLLVKTGGTKDRFLCGHDEREWFVAAVPGNASNVAVSTSSDLAASAGRSSRYNPMACAMPRITPDSAPANGSAVTTARFFVRANGSSCRLTACLSIPGSC